MVHSTPDKHVSHLFVEIPDAILAQYGLSVYWIGCNCTTPDPTESERHTHSSAAHTWKHTHLQSGSTRGTFKGWTSHGFPHDIRLRKRVSLANQFVRRNGDVHAPCDVLGWSICLMILRAPVLVFPTRLMPHVRHRSQLNVTLLHLDTKRRFVTTWFHLVWLCLFSKQNSLCLVTISVSQMLRQARRHQISCSPAHSVFGNAVLNCLT